MTPSNQLTDQLTTNQLILAIAGSTAHTVQCADVLLQDPRFSISWVLTPEPKPIGRKQLITKNPVHKWAEKNNIPVILVKKKIDQQIKEQIQLTNQQTHQPASYFLVVDFGYLIPAWLLQLPNIAPINIHPSELPKYRGSSPGQFALLFGEKKSAVSVIKMNEKLDEGDLIYQEKFDVPSTINLNEYYDFSFSLITKTLPQVLCEFATQRITAIPQPLVSPTPIARRLTREDGYIEWNIVKFSISNLHFSKPTDQQTTNQLLLSAYQHHGSWPQTIFHAVRAFSPWPGIWTIVPTLKGKKRLKILEVKIDNDRLQLTKVQLEGYTATTFEEIQNQLIG